MNFRFNIGKATETACLLLERAGGRMNVMKLVKLMYLLDRLSLDRRGIPVVGGDYLSMRNGPVTSEVLDLINEGRLYHESDARWDECISDRENHDVALSQLPEREQVSNAEVKLLDEIWATHG
ncbi:MAG: Panacea domain-containing protein, partial [Verrucomicrobia bacterium]|nr:Panacea domain-containing protein [Verrucomicrobiota bacterium]